MVFVAFLRYILVQHLLSENSEYFYGDRKSSTFPEQECQALGVVSDSVPLPASAWLMCRTLHWGEVGLHLAVLGINPTACSVLNHLLFKGT